MSNHGLSEADLAQIRAILAPFAATIEQVGLFGSRATGRWRDASDIDLILYDPLEEAVVDRLWTLFGDSTLPVNVDVVGYRHITTPALKDHIDRVMLPLFSQKDLTC